jgi:hypothetical protein
VRKCSVLYINACKAKTTEARALRGLGFQVVEVDDIPAVETITAHHAVVIHTRPECRLAAIATRLRARPKFGRRVLIALVPASVSTREQREGLHSGFSLTLPEALGARALAARMLHELRKYPEFRCLLRRTPTRRKAAAARRRRAA